MHSGLLNLCLVCLEVTVSMSVFLLGVLLWDMLADAFFPRFAISANTMWWVAEWAFYCLIASIVLTVLSVIAILAVVTGGGINAH